MPGLGSQREADAEVLAQRLLQRRGMGTRTAVPPSPVTTRQPAQLDGDLTEAAAAGKKDIRSRRPCHWGTPSGPAAPRAGRTAAWPSRRTVARFLIGNPAAASRGRACSAAWRRA